MRQLLVISAVMAALAPAAKAEMVFEGRVEAIHTAEVAPARDGIIDAILFRAGERVAAGQPMIKLRPHRAKLALTQATAARDRAAADLDLARSEFDRIETLVDRGTGTGRALTEARARLAIAEADLTAATATLETARITVADSVISAPIDGYAGPIHVSPGAYVEAEAGNQIATITGLDPVRIAYVVPAEDRLALLQSTGAGTLEALFDQLTLEITLPGGQVLADTPRPETASATVTPETGAFTVWTTVANPDALLRPGMAVTVRSYLTEMTQ